MRSSIRVGRNHAIKMNYAAMAQVASVESAKPAPHVGLYVQYGCGLTAPEGWLNFDASPRLRLERVPALRTVFRATVGLLFPSNARTGNIVRGLPVPDGSASGVYCSHVLEHLPRDDLPEALRNTLRILCGCLACVGPTGAADIWHPRKGRSKRQSRSTMGRRTKSINLIALMRDHCGNSTHLWMYDFAALKALLEDAGFVGIRRCEFGDASDGMFALVEDHGRFFDGGERELAIEAIRPSHPINANSCSTAH